MIPIRLSLSGFLSYHESVEIDFTRFSLACISGANGAGKSSLLDAITWALFGQARKRDDALINSQGGDAQVELIFAYEGNVYRVLRSKKRDKPAVLEFQILQNLEAGWPPTLPAAPAWKPLTEHTFRETEKRIAETLRMDYETFINASFFLQGKADQFTQQRPGDRKRILGSILGLEIWETYRERAAKRRQGVEVEFNRVEAIRKEVQAELDQEEARRQKLAALQAELTNLAGLRQAQENSLAAIRQVIAALARQKELVDQLKRQAEQSWQRLENARLRLNERQGRQAEFQRSLEQAQAIEAAYAAWQEARRQLAEWEAIAGRFREHEKRREAPRQAIGESRARLEQERQTLLARQAAEQEHALAQEALQAELQVGLGSLKQIEARFARRQEVDDALQAARRRQAEAQAENQALRRQMDELKAHLNQLEQLEAAECPFCGQPLSLEDRQRLLKELEAQGKEMGDRYRANRALVESCLSQVTALEAELAGFAQVENDLRSQAGYVAGLQARWEQGNARQQEWQTTGLARLDELTDLLAREAYALEARAELAQIDAELRAIGYDAEAHDRIRQQELAGQESEAARRTLDQARAALQPLEEEIASLERQLKLLQEEANSHQAEYTGAAAEYQAAEAQAPDLEHAEEMLLEFRDQENNLRLQVGAASQEVQVLEILKTRRVALEAQKHELGSQAGYYRQLESALGKNGVPALLIEQALPEIEARANEILDRLSAGGMTVRFVTQAAYKDKNREDLKETLEIQISDAAGDRDYEMFSGGEAFRVNFAIRLALSEVLAQRAGARLQTLVIDEGFGSQDAEGRQRLIEAINLVRPDFEKILVITHIDELKDAFPTRLEVEKTLNGSVVRMVD